MVFYILCAVFSAAAHIAQRLEAFYEKILQYISLSHYILYLAQKWPLFLASCVGKSGFCRCDRQREAPEGSTGLASVEAVNPVVRQVDDSLRNEATRRAPGVRSFYVAKFALVAATGPNALFLIKQIY